MEMAGIFNEFQYMADTQTLKDKIEAKKGFLIIPKIDNKLVSRIK
jgi:hypothetical protein